MNQVARSLGTSMSWHPASDIVERSTRASVTLMFDNNKSLVMKNVLFENRWEDAQKVFAFIQNEHPEIHFES